MNVKRGELVLENVAKGLRESAEQLGFDVVEDESEHIHIPLDIGSMTIAQAKEYCEKNRSDKCGKHCEFRRRHICGYGCAVDIYQWDLARLTPHELEICRVLGAKWVSKDNYKETVAVNLWNQKPELGDDGKVYRKGKIIADISVFLFPSVKQGDCICVDNLGKSDDA